MAATGTVNAYSNRHRQINLDRLRQAAVEQRQESQEDDRRRARLRHEAKERLRRLQAKREASQQATEHKRQAQLAARRQEIQDTNHAYLHHNAARRHTSVGDQHQSHPHDTADGSDHDWAQARSYHHPPPVHRAPSPSLQGPFPQRRVPGAAVEKNMARDDAHRDAVLSDAYSLLAQFRQHPPDAGPPPPEGPYSYPAGLAVFRGPSEEDIQRVWNSIRDMTHQNRPAYTNHDHLSRPSQSRGSHRRHHFSREAPATYAANAHPYPSSQASNDSPPQPGQYYGKLHTRSSSQGAVAPPPQGPPPRHERPSLRTHQDPRHAESHSNMAHAQNKAWSRPAAQPYNHYQNSGDADSIEGAHAPHPAAHAPHLARTYSNSSRASLLDSIDSMDSLHDNPSPPPLAASLNYVARGRRMPDTVARPHHEHAASPLPPHDHTLADPHPDHMLVLRNSTSTRRAVPFTKPARVQRSPAGSPTPLSMSRDPDSSIAAAAAAALQSSSESLDEFLKLEKAAAQHKSPRPAPVQNQAQGPPQHPRSRYPNPAKSKEPKHPPASNANSAAQHPDSGPSRLPRPPASASTSHGGSAASHYTRHRQVRSRPRADPSSAAATVTQQPATSGPSKMPSASTVRSHTAAAAPSVAPKVRNSIDERLLMLRHQESQLSSEVDALNGRLGQLEAGRRLISEEEAAAAAATTADANAPSGQGSMASTRRRVPEPPKRRRPQPPASVTDAASASSAMLLANSKPRKRRPFKRYVRAEGYSQRHTGTM